MSAQPEQWASPPGHDDGMALIGVNYAGRVTAALALLHATRTEVREFYRDMAETRRTVERTTVEDARARLQL